LVIWWKVIFINMSLRHRKKSGNKFAGSKTIVRGGNGPAILTVKPGGENKINRQGPLDPRNPNGTTL